MNPFLLVKLIMISITVRIYASIKNLPGLKIDSYIRVFALVNIAKIGINRALILFINPVSSIRYFEFDFALKYLKQEKKCQILDVSSPRFFALYFTQKHKVSKYIMVNPDKRDLLETKRFVNIHPARKEISLQSINATKLLFKRNTFDVVISISVIEHIGGKDDTKAIKEMWRVLKKGGKLIITTHIARKERIEYRSKDQYGLDKNKKKKKYFFQRIYSKSSLESRIIKSVGKSPDIIRIWGEKEKGWFDGYIKRWIEKGIKETVYDPFYMSTKFVKYNNIEELPGIGLIGMVFKKT